MKKHWLGAAIAALCLSWAGSAAAQIGTVTVTGGQVRGVSADGITAFKGIPFAASPVGNLRWRAPQPVVPWSGVKPADHFGPSCMQDPKALEQFGAPPAMSEDCLYLNVWTPAQSARQRLPVMIWIHGGGLNVGMTSVPTFDGTRLAHKGVVLVSIPYRLGAFGFLADARLSAESPRHASGNYGLLDVVAALQWVQTNVAKLGGDPSRVTVFGQSVGGSIVGQLAISPLGKGLFQRAISESGELYGMGGGFDALNALHAAESSGSQFLATLGARDITAARALPAEAIVKAQDHFEPRFVRDAYVLPDNNYELFQAGRFRDTPLLLGSNADEGRMLAPPGVTPTQFQALVHTLFGPDADSILALYPHAADHDAERAARDLVRDGLESEAWAWANLYSKKSRDNVYLYYFDRYSPQAPQGPTHGAENAYIFGNLVSPVKGGSFGLTGTPGPEDVALSEQMQDYWVNFARTGDPNGPGLPRWPAFSAASQQALYLDTLPHAGPMPNLKQLKALDAYFGSQREETRSKHVQSPDRTYLKSKLATEQNLPFSSGVISGDTLYIAGTTATGPGTAGGAISAEVEAHQVMNDVKQVVEQAGMTMDDVVSIQVFCTSLADYDTFNRVYRTYFHGHYPARAFVAVNQLLFGARFEVMGIATKSRK